MKARLISSILVFAFALAAVSAQGDNTALINQLKVYQAETHHGDAHVERWTRALAALGSGSHANPMTLSDAQEMADRFSRRRWQPVVDALQALQTTPPETETPAINDNPWDTQYGPSWVDGTNCYWWVDSETVRVREFSAFNDWIDVTENGATAPAWVSAYGSYVTSSREPMPQVIEFQIGDNEAYRVSRFLAGGNAHSIMEYVNTYAGLSVIYASDSAACNVASRIFTPQGNFR